MTETIAANRICNFTISFSPESIREGFFKGDQETLNLIYCGCIDDLYRNANSFNTHTNFAEIKRVVLTNSSEISLNVNSNLVYSEKMNSEPEVWISGKYFSNNLQHYPLYAYYFTK